VQRLVKRWDGELSSLRSVPETALSSVRYDAVRYRQGQSVFDSTHFPKLSARASERTILVTESLALNMNPLQRTLIKGKRLGLQTIVSISYRSGVPLIRAEWRVIDILLFPSKTSPHEFNLCHCQFSKQWR
jgi:hypothetical protein